MNELEESIQNQLILLRWRLGEAVRLQKHSKDPSIEKDISNLEHRIKDLIEKELTLDCCLNAHIDYSSMFYCQLPKGHEGEHAGYNYYLKHATWK